MASARISRFPADPSSNEILLDDFRFHALLPDEEWGRLPLAIWRRFSKRLADGKTVVYVGEVDDASFSRIGWLAPPIARRVRGAGADRRRDEGPDDRDGDGRCGPRRPDLDRDLRAPARLSASYSFFETLLRPD